MHAPKNYGTVEENLAFARYEIVIEKTRRIFLEKGELPALVMIGFLNGDEFNMTGLPASDFMRDSQTKDMLAEMMKDIGKDLDPVCICLMCEAWVAKVDIKEPGADELISRLKEDGVSQYENRIEVLLFTFESENFCKTITYEIIRGDELSLKELDSSGDDTEMAGRFANILKDMKKIRWN